MYRQAKLFIVLFFLSLSATYSAEVVVQPNPQDGVDVWITDTFSYNSDYGVDDGKLQVGGWGDLYYALLKFDLNGLPTQATSAVIELYAYSRGDSSTPVSMYLDRVTTAWDENAGWNNRPEGVTIRTISQPAVSGWYSIDITAVYNAWKSGTSNHGIRLRPTNNANNFNTFYSSDYMGNPSLRPKLKVTTGFSLSFPVSGYTAYTAPISSIFDHSARSSTQAPRDRVVVAYTGETGEEQLHSTDPSCISQGGEEFIVNGNYVGAASCGGSVYLSYDGHNGIDYSFAAGTPVYSTADGIITASDCPKLSTGISCQNKGTRYGKLSIDHGNGYSTIYLHLSAMANGVNINTWYPKGTLVGYSGNTAPSYVAPHLHVSISKNGIYVDPYGWTASFADPYPGLNGGVQNVRLWE